VDLEADDAAAPHVLDEVEVDPTLKIFRLFGHTYGAVSWGCAGA
jgi:hypothetical protein